jgi:hypothetical protein
MSENERTGLYVVIPSTVRHSKSLLPEAKLLYGDICGLARKTGYCYASTEHLQEVCGLSRRQVLRLLKNLEVNGFIVRESEGLQRHIVVTQVTPSGDIKGTESGDVKGTILLHTTNTVTSTYTSADLIYYFHFEKGLPANKAQEEAEAFHEYHLEKKTNMSNGWRRHASTWFRNGVKYYNSIVDPGKGKTREEIANPDTGLIDTSRWELRGKLYYRR